uniref:Uncharacterized protein n=1 Tax=Strongyloides papillosus TaxID=174720 RepID=A0A0N5CI61_STREA
MNSLSVVIFIAILINILFGYKTNCTRDIRIPCAVYLTPSEDAYRKLLQTIDPYDKLNYGIGLGPYDTDWKKIRKENQAIKKLGDQTIVSQLIIGVNPNF